MRSLAERLYGPVRVPKGDVREQLRIVTAQRDAALRTLTDLANLDQMYEHTSALISRLVALLEEVQRIRLVVRKSR